MPLSSSAGWPWRHKYRNKAKALEQEPNMDQWMFDGENRVVCWHGFAKLEVLPKEKAAVKARLVTGGPVDLIIGGARLCEDFNEQFTNLHTVTHSAVGMSKYHGGWTELARKFPTVGRSTPVVEADAKQWDSGMSDRLLRAVWSIRWSCLRDEDRTPENWRAHNAYLWNLIRGLCHISDGGLFAISGGQKSGSINTTSDNTLGHIIVCAYAWIRSGGVPEKFWDHPFALYGDDFLSSSVGLPKDFFAAYRETGIKLPEENVVFHDDITSASFLSTGFRRVGRDYIGVPKNGKALFALATCDHRPTLDLAHQRALALWLESYWTEDSEILRKVYVELCEKLCISPYTNRWARDLWLGWESGPRGPLQKQSGRLWVAPCHVLSGRPPARCPHAAACSTWSCTPDGKPAPGKSLP